jgi:hypothetical protein
MKNEEKKYENVYDFCAQPQHFYDRMQRNAEMMERREK